MSLDTQMTELADKLNGKRDELKAIFDESGPERDMSKVKSLDGDSMAKVEEIRKRNAEIDDLASQYQGLVDVKKAAENAGAARIPGGTESGDGGVSSELGPDVIASGKFKSLGDWFIQSKAMKGYARGSGAGPTDSIEVDLKTLLDTTGWVPETTRTPRLEYLAGRPAPHVIDFIPKTQTSQAAVVYMEETTFTNNAAEVAEAGTYGEAALALTEKTQTVRKIGVWIPVTDETFEDLPRARDYVDNRLRYMLEQRLDLQALRGNGTAPNLLGTENVSGIQTQALGTDPIQDAVFKVQRKIRDDGFAEPNVIFLAPSKWETVRLQRTTDGIYVFGNPFDAGPERMWGIPVVQTTAVTSTVAVTGDYANFAELAIRRGIDMQITNSHSTFFIEGKLAIRMDLRAALMHYRPKAFGKVTGL